MTDKKLDARTKEAASDRERSAARELRGEARHRQRASRLSRRSARRSARSVSPRSRRRASGCRSPSGPRLRPRILRCPTSTTSRRSIAPDTVDTMPPETLEAYRDHGDPKVRIGDDLAGRPRRVPEPRGARRRSRGDLPRPRGRGRPEVLRFLRFPDEDSRREAEDGGGRLKLDLGPAAGVHEEAIDRLEQERAVERIWAEDASLWKAEPVAPQDDRERARMADDRRSHGAGGRGSCGRSRPTPPAAPIGSSCSAWAARASRRSSFRTRFRGSRELSAARGPRLDRARRACSPSLRGGSASRTIYVVSSKSGTTLEPNIFFDFFYAEAEKELGGTAGSRFVVITDPGSALEKEAARRKVRRIFPGDPQDRGRYSALSNFGLVPAAFAGVDVGGAAAAGAGDGRGVPRASAGEPGSRCWARRWARWRSPAGTS